MYERVTVSEITHFIYKMNGIAPQDVGFDFLMRWLRAEEEIFLFEHKPGWYRPEIFQLATGPVLKPPDARGGPEFLELPMDRLSILHWFEPGSADSIFKEIGYILSDQRLTQKRGNIELLKKITINDLQNDHWDILNRLMVTTSLAMRYCWHAWGEVPAQVINKLKEMAPRPTGRGQKPNIKMTKNDYCNFLDILIQIGVHKPRKEGVNDAALMIHEIWQADHKVSFVYNSIKDHYQGKIK